MKRRCWEFRFLLTLLAAGGWRDLRTCRYLARNADWENGEADPVQTARDELSYMASDLG